MKTLVSMALCLYFLLNSGSLHAASYFPAAPFSSNDVEVYVSPACSPGHPSGNIRVKILIGTAPYDISLYKQSAQPLHTQHLPAGNTDHTFEELLPGIYLIKVSDATCGVAELEVEVGVKNPFIISANVKDICLQGTGSISLDVSGGAEPYTYKWSNDRSGLPTITGKYSGIYTVTITDTNGCSVVREYEIKIKNLDLSGVVTDPILCGLEQTSDIEVIVHNGKEPFVYQWSSGETYRYNIYVIYIYI